MYVCFISLHFFFVIDCSIPCESVLHMLQGINVSFIDLFKAHLSFYLYGSLPSSNEI